MKLRAVIFDFGNVLCFPPTDRQFSEAAALCGLSTPEFVHAFWLKRLDYDRGTDPASYWRDFASLNGLALDDAMVEEMIRREIAFWSHYDARLLAWTTDLRRAGLRTSILSNLPMPIGESLRASDGFLDHFDQVTFSYKLGVIKPEPGIYRFAIQGLGVAPEEALFLDDRSENVEGARAIGLHAEVFTTWEEFLDRHLARYGLPEPSPQPA